MIAEGFHAATRCRPQGDKVMRLNAQQWIPARRAPWLAPYLGEFTAFPNAKHDDQVDLDRSDADWFKVAGHEPGGFYAYYRILAKELLDRQTVKPHRYRLVAPAVVICGGDA